MSIKFNYNDLFSIRTDDYISYATEFLSGQNARNDIVETFENKITSTMPVDWRLRFDNFIIDSESLNDAELVSSFNNSYEICDDFFESFDLSRGLLLTKVNHGFWEHAAILGTKEIFYSSYRDFNVLRLKTIYSDHFMKVFFGCWFASQSSSNIFQFISCTTGKYSISQTIGDFRSNTFLNENLNFQISNFKRGALKGLLGAAKLHRQLLSVDNKFNCIDSYWLNSKFEDCFPIANFIASSNKESACLIIGPSHLSGLRVKDWSGDQFFLHLSSSNAMNEWKFLLNNIEIILREWDVRYNRVLILFQGAALSPVVTSFIEYIQINLKNRINFIDYGRLLDVEFGSDITKTGSPLPSDKFDSFGQFEFTSVRDSVFFKY